MVATVAILNSCKNEPAEPDCSSLVFSTTVSDENCSDQDGEITVVASGGEGTYEYSMDGGATYQSASVFTGLEAGSYSLVVKDGNACETAASTVEVVKLASTVAFTTTLTDAGCGTSVGQILVNATGGDGTYMYSSDGFTFVADSALTGLSSGTYTVVVQDGNGCSSSESVFVSAGNVSYSTDVAPIISQSCGVTNCHDGSNSFRSTLTNYTGLFNNRLGSLSRINSGAMPKSPGTISNADKQTVLCWLEDGAPNN